MTGRAPIRRAAGVCVVLCCALPSAVRGQPESPLDASDTSDAWFVSFAVNGFLDTINKEVNGAVRAVRREP